MTHSELIQALGGGTKVAAQLSELSGTTIDREAVYKWRENNWIAWRWRPLIASLASGQGISVPTDFFRVTERPSTEEAPQ